MKIDSSILIKQYYEEVAEQYPELSFEEFKEICKQPFQFLKDEMEKGELPTIRLKYLGTFLVYPKRAEHLRKKVIDRDKYNKIGKKEFSRIKTMLDKFLDNE